MSDELPTPIYDSSLPPIDPAVEAELSASIEAVKAAAAKRKAVLGHKRSIRPELLDLLIDALTEIEEIYIPEALVFLRALRRETPDVEPVADGGQHAEH